MLTPLQPPSGTDVVPTINSVRTELLTRRSQPARRPLLRLMRPATHISNVAVLLLAAAHVALAGQATPVPQQTVCGTVERVTCEGKAARLTTLRLKGKSKDLPVTIPPASRAQFTPPPEELYRDTEVCATGRVERDGRRRRLIVSGPQDIAIRKQLQPPATPWKATFSRDCDEGVKMPVLIHDVRPNYTRAAMEARRTGIVELEAIVNTDGVVGEIRIRRSLDAEFGLDDDAIRAVTVAVFTGNTVRSAGTRAARNRAVVSTEIGRTDMRSTEPLLIFEHRRASVRLHS